MKDRTIMFKSGCEPELMPLRIKYRDKKKWYNPFSWFVEEEKTMWQLLKPIYIIYATEITSYSFTIPNGFKTDLASIPKTFWSIISPLDPEIIKSSILHDYLYSAGTTTKAMADYIFLVSLKEDGCSFVKRQAIYNAVRIGGWSAWNKCRKKDKKNKKDKRDAK